MNHQKKTLCIAGSMLLPIKVGEPAMIREHDGGYRRTTTVLKMDKLSDSEIKFETQNTHYVAAPHQSKGGGSMSKEPKDERFIRLAEARVNKIIKMVRLLVIYPAPQTIPTPDSQVEQIYDALQTELDKSRKRFTAAKTGKKRFSLSDSYEPDTPQERYPTIVLALPDGTYLPRESN